ncbi:MAG: UDP-glucose 4-epimerase GalE [Oscillospiraceae bacterium]|nr:UDP-glucose 4-epimerase GalE [Oscillospiraceae bacterium]
MAILVTGGAGYIGSHTCVELLNKGEEVIIVDNFSNSSPDVIKKIGQITGKSVTVYSDDILSEAALHNIFTAHKISAVVHFAGLKAVGESVRVPMDYYYNNVSGTLCLCRVMAAHGCKKMAFSSSATVYGAGTGGPFREDDAVSAINPYGMTKVMIERILTDIAAADPKWGIALLRYFNPIGAHPSGLLGEDPTGIPNNLVPYIAQVASGKLARVQVYGDDYETPDGTGVRDYLHVSDLAAGHIKALEYVENHPGAEAVNLGTGTGYSVLEVLAAYEKACGKKLPYVIAPRREGDTAVCCADPAKAKRLLGWEAAIGLDEMCRDSWNYAKKLQKG